MYEDILQIRYIKLTFRLEMLEDAVLPKSKVSALRGGIGEMLLQANCIRDRQCESCSFASECVVQRTMYTKIDDKPEFMTGGDSIGYVVDCHDFREEVAAGDSIRFSLTLFGNTLVYFNLYLQAVDMLGRSGLGKEKARFCIRQIYNTFGEPFLDGYDLNMERYRIQTIQEYVDYRMRDFKEANHECTVQFQTPLTLKYRGEFLSEFRADALVKAIQRRLYILDCYEKIAARDFYEKELPAPVILEQEAVPRQIRRYSSRKESAMYLKGITGYVRMNEVTEEVLPLLLAAEVVHIGKNTSFGFGKVRVD